MGLSPLGPRSENDCAAMLARLYTYLDGELTDERREHIQHHLDGCPTYFSAFDFEAELRIIVANRLRSHVPPALVERVRMVVRDNPLEF